LGIKVSHTFNNPGQYSVKLKITDSKDNKSEAANTIKVDNAPLRALISAGTSTCVSSPVSFDTSSNIDQDNDITGHEWYGVNGRYTRENTDDA